MIEREKCTVRVAVRVAVGASVDVTVEFAKVNVAVRKSVVKISGRVWVETTTEGAGVTKDVST